MTVLVTGASGAVAQAVIADLEPDHELRLFARRHPNETGRPPKRDLPFVRGDLLELDDCRRAVEGVSAILHIGANNWIGPDTWKTNTLSTYYLLEAAREQGIHKVVFASSNCALGHCAPISGRFVPDTFPIDEQHPDRVEDEYGLSKLVNEQTLAAYARSYGIQSYALRLAGCWGDEEYARLLDGPNDPAHGAVAFWAYVDMCDVAQAFRKALHAPAMATPACVPLYINAADTSARQPTAELVARFFPALADRAASLSGHVSLFSWYAARDTIGYEPQHSWRDFGSRS